MEGGSQGRERSGFNDAPCCDSTADVSVSSDSRQDVLASSFVLVTDADDDDVCFKLKCSNFLSEILQKNFAVMQPMWPDNNADIVNKNRSKTWACSPCLLACLPTFRSLALDAAKHNKFVSIKILSSQPLAATAAIIKVKQRFGMNWFHFYACRALSNPSEVWTIVSAIFKCFASTVQIIWGTCKSKLDCPIHGSFASQLLSVAVWQMFIVVK